MTARPATSATKARRLARSVHFEVRRLCDPETGEVFGALVPATKVDRRLMRERKYGIGTRLRGELREARNIRFWGLAHVLAAWCVDHVEGFELLATHDALKKIQKDSGIGCVTETFDVPVPELGTTLTIKRNVAESLNFDDMDEGRFRELWDGGNGEGGWLGWLRSKLGDLPRELLDEFEAIVTKDGA